MKKTECKRGHPLDGPDADVRVYKGKDGHTQRVCRACERERQQHYRNEIRWNYLKVRGML